MPEPDMSVWTGRVDTADGPNALRWHQMVKPLAADSPPGVVLIGFACDEGVRRNGGRVGAKDGPRAIRAALANLAWHQYFPVYDAGDVPLMRRWRYGRRTVAPRGSGHASDCRAPAACGSAAGTKTAFGA